MFYCVTISSENQDIINSVEGNVKKQDEWTAILEIFEDPLPYLGEICRNYPDDEISFQVTNEKLYYSEWTHTPEYDLYINECGELVLKEMWRVEVV